MTISWNTVIFKFRWIFGTDERRILSRQTIHTSSCGSPLFHVSLLPRINGLPQKHCMEGLSRHNSLLIRRKNPAKFENDRISRNGHRIKITQPNWMIKASFSSAEYSPSNDVNIYNTFSSQCTENPPFRFFWDTRYNCLEVYWNKLFVILAAIQHEARSFQSPNLDKTIIKTLV